MALDNVYQAGGDAGTSKFEEKIFEDQLLPHVNRLQQYRQSSSENKSTACSLQEEALRAIYRIYSLKLRPTNLLETSSETRLQKQLLELIYQPCGIHDDSSNPSAVPTIEDPNSPFWNLHDWSLKLTRLLIDNGHLSAETMIIVEDHFTKLLETIQECRLKGQACPRTSKNIAIIAHCLCKIFKINKSTGSAQRRLLSPSFICDHLFPLACEFIAEEYPASILDPISYYELFESSGKLVEPDEALVEWNRRNQRKTAPRNSRNSSKRIKLGDECSVLKEDDVHSLPSAHVCLEHLIYQLTMSSNQTDQDVIVKFLRRKVSDIRDQPNGDNIDRSRTGSEVLMNQIVALHVIGRVRLQLIPSEEISFFRTLVLPTLKQDCLLLKICKYQLVRFLKIDDESQRICLTQFFLHEFMKIIELEDYQDEHNKLSIIFASVASECLHKFSDCERLKSLFNTYLRPLDHESQLILVGKITNLYLDYKIVALLALVDIIYARDQGKAFSYNIERLMTEVVDSIAEELLVTSPDSDRAQNLSQHLYKATWLRGLLLPAATANKLVKLAKMSKNDDYGPALTFLECALLSPLDEQTKCLAIEMLGGFIKDLSGNDELTMNIVTMILGNLSYHQVTSSSLAPISNNSTTSSMDMHDQHRSRNPLFESPGIIKDVLAWCERIDNRTDLTSRWVMNILMSWPSLRVASVIEPPSAVSSTESMWHCFVDFAVRMSDKFNLSNTLITSTSSIENDDDKNYETCHNLLFAFMAAINYDPERLEDYLNYIIEPTGRGQSHISNYVKLWLDVVIRNGDSYKCPDCDDLCFTRRSYLVISHQALINIHQSQTADKLGISIKRLARKLNSARRIVRKWLVDKRQQAIETDSPLEKFYVNSIRQLEKIGSFK